jgi:hypothetical protein
MIFICGRRLALPAFFVYMKGGEEMSNLINTSLSIEFLMQDSKQGSDNYLSDEAINDIKDRAAKYFAQNNGIFINLEMFYNRLMTIGKIIEKNLDLYKTGQNIIENTEKLRESYSIYSSNQKTGEDRIEYEKLTNFNFLTNDMKQNIEIEKSRTALNKALAEGYYLIMRFRAEILKEKIDYGIYVGTDVSNAELLNIKEDNILYFMNFGNKGEIVLNTQQYVIKRIKELLSSQEEGKEIGVEIDDYKSAVYREFVSTIIDKDFEKTEKGLAIW